MLYEAIMDEEKVRDVRRRGRERSLVFDDEAFEGKFIELFDEWTK